MDLRFTISDLRARPYLECGGRAKRRHRFGCSATAPRKPKRCRRFALPPHSKGFTLVEILVVVAIIGIVMTISIPTLHRMFNPDSIDQAVRDIMEACREARSSAILGSVPVDVVIRSEDGQISVQAAGSVGKASDPFEDRSDELSTASDDARPTASATGGGLNFKARLSENITPEIMEVNFQDQMELTEVRVRFFPNGISHEFKCLLLHPASGQRRLITVDPITGLAEVESDPTKWR